ncbi:hypothetical protein PM1_011 [Pectobacterium phage PM1]|uniref:Uncharacterized protein n=1 Tax=Pectobacterium phage PM1 TaxID=1399915 RepID=X2CRN1_9CAUD|nr:hypothetical protein PM1_011 [Pectobacterium phage PM1]AGV99227.1 hypothetical protein PM1_011 [Pectobacterium phage PM1]
MDIKDLPKSVDNINLQVQKQQAYMDTLTSRFQDGQTEIEVYTEDPGVWTMVPLQAFWQLQQDKLIALMEYQGILNSAQTTLQVKLDEILTGVVVPPASKM